MRTRLAFLALLVCLSTVTGCHKKKGGYLRPTPAEPAAATR